MIDSDWISMRQQIEIQQRLGGATQHHDSAEVFRLGHGHKSGPIRSMSSARDVENDHEKTKPHIQSRGRIKRQEHPQKN